MSEYDSPPPEEYRGSRRDEYEELLSRGATRLMCETFHLEYTEDRGIHAWADWEIYHHYADPHVQKGDFWKIHLSRRVELDEEDLDGSMFIEDLLEDVRTDDHKEDYSNHDDILSEDDPSEHECLSQLSDAMGDEDEELENPPGPGVHALNVYSSGDDTDSEGQEISDDDDFGLHNSLSDSDDREVYDTASVGFTGPDGVWDSEMDDSEDEDYTPKAESEEPPMES